ncbi:hypothetical protein BVY04_05225 [bacterium M21]|nr:hypothetical protein BVY04_05225 [bacterium M21]
MSPREKIQLAYELAFFPPRLHQLWTDLKHGDVARGDDVIELLEMALSLHQALPERGYSSFRALKRIAIYQANSRLFGTVTFLRNILAYLEVDFRPPVEVPGQWVRDIGLPEFGRKPKSL